MVLFENFETGEIADLNKRWSEISNHDGKVLAFSAEHAVASGGRLPQATLKVNV